ncbi:MAG: sugar transferase [Bacteroidales bacterium]|nr:sugar transferase [Bacteroidales bacterium]
MSEIGIIHFLYIGENQVVVDMLASKPDLVSFHHVENALEAVQYIKSNSKVRAILCEAWLLGVTGISFFEFLKTTPIAGSRQIPFFLLNKDFDQKLYKEAVLAGVDDYFTQPYNLDNIILRTNFSNKYYQLFVNQDLEGRKPEEFNIDSKKRIFDIVVAGGILLFASPFLAIICFAIWAESGFKGKVYYTSKRFGRYRIFDFYKLRSMYLDADKRLKEVRHLNQYASAEVEMNDDNMVCPFCSKLIEGQYCSNLLYDGGQQVCEYIFLTTRKKKGQAAFLKIKNDPRVTVVGKFIRNTSIDELPQLINVLKGDMSIVGNRPLPLYEAYLLTSDQYSARFGAPAGITGLWQVELRGKGGVMSEEERKSLDNIYAENHSFWGDIKLILRTIPALFQKENV